MKRIKQKHDRGCSIACLAMLTGKTYDQVLEDCAPAWDENVGLYSNIVDGYLWDHGYALKKIFEPNNWKKEKRHPWPVKPFTDIHLVFLRVYEQSPCDHFIVMLKDGTLLDPKLDGQRSLNDYYRVYSITGVYLVGN